LCSQVCEIVLSGPALKRNIMIAVEVYYVECPNCDREIEIDRKPRASNLAAAIGVTWKGTLKCTCGAKRTYGYGDLKRSSRV
jgi:hypothetical protein